MPEVSGQSEETSQGKVFCAKNLCFIQLTHIRAASYVAQIEKECVKDDRNAALFHVHFPRSELNKLGYPHWDINHPAQNLLKLDVENKRHEQKISSTLPPHQRRCRHQCWTYP